jgi:hypothetical protein
LKQHDLTLTLVAAKDRIFFIAAAPCAAQATGQEDANARRHNNGWQEALR